MLATFLQRLFRSCERVVPGSMARAWRCSICRLTWYITDIRDTALHCTVITWFFFFPFFSAAAAVETRGSTVFFHQVCTVIGLIGCRYMLCCQSRRSAVHHRLSSTIIDVCDVYQNCREIGIHSHSLDCGVFTIFCCRLQHEMNAGDE